MSIQYEFNSDPAVYMPHFIIVSAVFLY